MYCAMDPARPILPKVTYPRRFLQSSLSGSLPQRHGKQVMVICKLQRSIDVVHRDEDKEIIQNTQNIPGILFYCLPWS